MLRFSRIQRILRRNGPSLLACKPQGSTIHNQEARSHIPHHHTLTNQGVEGRVRQADPLDLLGSHELSARKLDPTYSGPMWTVPRINEHESCRVTTRTGHRRFLLKLNKGIKYACRHGISSQSDHSVVASALDLAAC